jgi:hypothetical protein
MDLTLTFRCPTTAQDYIEKIEGQQRALSEPVSSDQTATHRWSRTSLSRSKICANWHRSLTIQASAVLKVGQVDRRERGQVAAPWR